MARLLRRLRALRLRWLRWVGQPVICRHRTHLIEIDPRDEFIAAELLVDGTWEEELIDAITRVPLQGRTAIDVGAHVGIHTLVLSDLVGPEGRVIALEPAPDNFVLLERNVARNQACNVTALPVAAGRAPGAAWLASGAPNLGGHRVVDVDTGLPVRRVTVDSIAEPASVAFVKIDAEGSEQDVLLGMTRILRESDDLTLVVEVDLRGSTRLDRCFALLLHLREDGFETRIFAPGPVPPEDVDIPGLAERYGVMNLVASRRGKF